MPLNVNWKLLDREIHRHLWGRLCERTDDKTCIGMHPDSPSMWCTRCLLAAAQDAVLVLTTNLKPPTFAEREK